MAKIDDMAKWAKKTAQRDAALAEELMDADAPIPEYVPLTDKELVFFEAKGGYVIEARAAAEIRELREENYVHIEASKLAVSDLRGLRASNARLRGALEIIRQQGNLGVIRDLADAALAGPTS